MTNCESWTREEALEMCLRRNITSIVEEDKMSSSLEDIFKDDSCGYVSVVDSYSKDDSVGDASAEDERVERLCGKVSSDSLLN